MRTLLVVLTLAAPVSAQTIVSTHPPLSPEEAVAVLRGSHSVADYTDYRSPGVGPSVVVMGPSTTPWDWPGNAFAPTRPLGNDAGYYAPDYAPFYVPDYAPHYGVYSRERTPRTRIDRPVAAPRPAEARHIVMPPAGSAGRAVRGR